MTPLKDPVFRSSDVTIAQRPIILGIELINGKPCFSVRQKGLTTGWYADAEEMALYAINQFDRKSGEHAKLPIAAEYMDKWKQENKKEPREEPEEDRNDEPGQSSPTQEGTSEAVPQSPSS